jgi:TolB protein
MDEDGGGRRQLTDRAAEEIAVSPDGASIAFSTLPDGTQSIFVRAASGENSRQVTKEAGLSKTPIWAPDGKLLFYKFDKPASLGSSIRRLSLSDLSTTLLIEDAPGSTIISPDGKLAGYIDADNRIKISPINTEGPTKHLFDVPVTNVFEVASTCGVVALLVWGPDSRTVLFEAANAGVSNVWSQSLTGGLPKKLANFHNDFIFSFALSRDGRKLACSRGTQVLDAVSIRISK